MAFQLIKQPVFLSSRAAVLKHHKPLLHALRPFSSSSTLRMSVEDNMKKAGIELPEVAAAAANYVSFFNASFTFYFGLGLRVKG